MKKIEFILFDLDNTLYQGSSGLAEELQDRMTRFVSDHFDITKEEAVQIKRSGFEKYGTTLQWMQREGGMKDPMPYLNYVHPVEISQYLIHEPKLRSLLQSISLPKAVFTNSPRFHAERILHFFGIRDCFTEIFDLLFNELAGKPQMSSYKKVLKQLDIPPEKVLFIDDAPSYLTGFSQLGGNCLLVDEKNRYNETPFSKIRKVHELPDFLRDMNL